MCFVIVRRAQALCTLLIFDWVYLITFSAASYPYASSVSVQFTTLIAAGVAALAAAVEVTLVREAVLTANKYHYGNREYKASGCVPDFDTEPRASCSLDNGM